MKTLKKALEKACSLVDAVCVHVQPKKKGVVWVYVCDAIEVEKLLWGVRELHSELGVGLKVYDNLCANDRNRARAFDHLSSMVIRKGWGTWKEITYDGDRLRCRKGTVAIWSGFGYNLDEQWRGLAK